MDNRTLLSFHMIFTSLFTLLPYRSIGHNLKQSVIWRSQHFETYELFTLEKDTQWKMRGFITAEPDKSSLSIRYEIEVDSQWRVQRVNVAIDGSSRRTFLLTKTSGGWFDQNGKAISGAEHCVDIDISLSPSTNTLPIRRLKLAEGEMREIIVLFIDLPSFSLQPVKQRYTNLGGNRFKYENLDSGFESVIEIDDSGLVTHYPGVWERIVTKDDNAFSNALTSQQPSPEIKKADRLYDELMGSWDIRSVDYSADGSKLEQEGEWIFSWILDGRAVQDVLIIPKRGLRSSTKSMTGNRYGTTLRILDRTTGRWKIYWNNPAIGASNELVGNSAGDTIVHTGKDKDGTLMRWIFTDIKPESFHWHGEISSDEGKTWILRAEFFGTRKK